MDDFECCASGSCEECRGPRGYSSEQRQRVADEYRDYDPPWVRERRRNGGEA